MSYELPCHFRKLPTEIRLVILGFVFHQGTIEVSKQPSSHDTSKAVLVGREAYGQVLPVCKAFEREGKSMLYGDNAIRIDGGDLGSFNEQILQEIGKGKVALLQCIKINELWKSFPDGIASTLRAIARQNSELSNLRRLVLLAGEDRFFLESTHGHVNEWYIAGLTDILPHLTTLIVNGNDLTLTVETIDAVHGVRQIPAPSTT